MDKVSALKGVKQELTKLVRSLVDHAEQLVGVDQVDEGGDVHRGLRCDEQHAEGDCQLVESVELPVLSNDRLSIEHSRKFVTLTCVHLVVLSRIAMRIMRREGTM